MKILKRYLSVFSVLLAGILWGIISIFIKALSQSGLDALQITFVRMLVSAPLMMLAVAFTDKNNLKIKLKDMWFFIGTGIISIVLFNACYFYTMIHSQTSVAVVLLYTSPVFIMLISRVVFKEKITSQKLIALAMTFVGCVFVAGLSKSENITSKIVLIGLASGLFYGLYTIFGRFALEKYNSLTVTAYTFVFGLVGAFPISNPDETFSIISKNPELIFWCIGIGVVCTILPYLFYTWGLSKMESSKAAIIVAVEPLVGAVMGMTFYNEEKSLTKIIGITLILLAIVLLNIKNKDNKTS